MSIESMTCAEAEPLLPLVADGAIDPDSDPGLFAHLAGCPSCQRIVASHDLIALAIARPAPPRRASMLRFWPYAAAAGLAVTVSIALLPQPAKTTAVVLTAQPQPVAPVAVVAATPAEHPANDVIAIPRSDGSTLYLVRRGEAWVQLDPANLDGPGPQAHSGGSGVQVRY